MQPTSKFSVTSPIRCIELRVVQTQHHSTISLGWVGHARLLLRVMARSSDRIIDSGREFKGNSTKQNLVCSGLAGGDLTQQQYPWIPKGYETGRKFHFPKHEVTQSKVCATYGVPRINKQVHIRIVFSPLRTVNIPVRLSVMIGVG